MNFISLYKLFPLRVVYAAMSLLLLNACAVLKKPPQLLLTKESYCNPPVNLNRNEHNISHNIDSVLSANHLLEEKFSVPSIILIHALGALNEVKQVVLLKDDTSNTLPLLQLKQHIHNTVLLANSEIAAIAAELDCEGQRIDQITQYVEAINSKQTTKLTVASIVIGAATGIAGALINNSNWNKSIAIGGGIAGAGVGIVTLYPKGKKIELVHKRNLLRTVWLQQNNYDIPPFLWFMLTEKRISNAGTSSLADNLKRRWIRFHFDGKVNVADASVNFTDGGIYRADDLHARAAMINQLRAEIHSLEQYVNIFVRELQ